MSARRKIVMMKDDDSSEYESSSEEDGDNDNDLDRGARDEDHEMGPEVGANDGDINNNVDCDEPGPSASMISRSISVAQQLEDSRCRDHNGEASNVDPIAQFFQSLPSSSANVPAHIAWLTHVVNSGGNGVDGGTSSSAAVKFPFSGPSPDDIVLAARRGMTFMHELEDTSMVPGVRGGSSKRAADPEGPPSEQLGQMSIRKQKDKVKGRRRFEPGSEENVSVGIPQADLERSMQQVRVKDEQARQDKRERKEVLNRQRDKAAKKRETTLAQRADRRAQQEQAEQAARDHYNKLVQAGADPAHLGQAPPAPLFPSGEGPADEVRLLNVTATANDAQQRPSKAQGQGKGRSRAKQPAESVPTGTSTGKPKHHSAARKPRHNQKQKALNKHI